MAKTRKKSTKEIIIKVILGIGLPFGIHLVLPFFKIYQNVDPFWWKASSIFLVGIPFLVSLNLLGFELDLKTISEIISHFKK